MLQLLFSLAMGMTGAIVCIHFNIGYWAAPIAAFFGYSLMGALLSGFFDGAERAERTEDAERFESIRHRYGNAAVFIGTACVFLGSLSDCEELADDLWHYGQSARVETLTGAETDFNVL